MMLTILYVFGALVVVLMVAGVLINKHLSIELSTVVNKPKNEVFEYLRLLKNHNQFNIWTMMDPDMKKEYRGTDGQEGFVYFWESTKQKNVGTGEQEIKKIVAGESIEYELRFIRPMNDVAKSIISTTAVSEHQTKIVWGFYSRIKFPATLMKPIIKNMLSKHLEESINNLKNVLEKNT